MYVSLIQLAVLEARIFLHHHVNDDKKLQSHQYELLQQLLESDPLLWVFNVCLQKGKRELVAFPQPVSGQSNDINLSHISKYPELKDICKIAAHPLGHSWVHFLVAGTEESRGLLFRPSLLPITEMNGLSSMGSLTTERQLKHLRNSHHPVKLSLMKNETMSVEPWHIATSLRGLSARADAVLLQRPYTDIEVQSEMDILLGTDRNRAWELVLQWRSTAIEHLKCDLFVFTKLFSRHSFQIIHSSFSNDGKNRK